MSWRLKLWIDRVFGDSQKVFDNEFVCAAILEEDREMAESDLRQLYTAIEWRFPRCFTPARRLAAVKQALGVIAPLVCDEDDS